MKSYSRNLVFKKSLQYFKGDELAANVWIDKYALKDKKGYIYEQTPEDMHIRLAKELSRIENKYPNALSEEKIFSVLNNFKYIIPQGSPMFGIGNDFTLTSLSNCFVIGSNDNSDSYGSIMRTDEEQVQLMKRRGGVGHDISHLRPSGAMANNSVLKGMAGSTLYMERYSNSTREVSQGDRRGALMLSTDVRHPDTEKFIDAKLETGKVTGANISVKITDKFMEAVNRDEDFIQTFPIDLDINNHTAFNESLLNGEIEYDKLYDLQYKGCYVKRIKARKLWNKIIFNAWKSAEPGVLFWDKVTSESPADSYGSSWKTISTNPCGELPLCEYDSCRLLAINLYSYVENPFTEKASFNFSLFKEHINIAQRLMDDIVDLEIEKIDAIISKIKQDPESLDIKKVELELWEKIKTKAQEGRRTGLGITAEGDMLAAMGMRYGLKESNDFSELVHEFLAVESYKTSIQLAKERGSFPIWSKEKEKKNPFIDRIINSRYFSAESMVDYGLYGRRNIANLTIAPTGSVSLLSQTTSGIEPVFLPYYKRRRKTDDPNKSVFKDEVGDMWEEYRVFHHKFVKWFQYLLLNKNKDFYEWFIRGDNISLSFENVRNFLNNRSQEEIDWIFKKSPYYKATSADVDYLGKVELQGRIQKWIDHSISVTVNMPEDVSVETVSDVYNLAHKVGCKGLTIYREGSRSGVLLSDKKKENEEDDIIYSNAPKRPETIICDIYNITRGKQPFTILVGLLNNKPYEIFALEKLSNSELSDRVTKGEIKKVKSKTYELSAYYKETKYVVNNIVDFMSKDEQKDTRKFSQMLRHGIKPKYIIEQINEYASISSFDKVIAKALSYYLNGESVKQDKVCPSCGSYNLKHENGCVTCLDCNWSKCN